jgi:hypothetical protein
MPKPSFACPCCGAVSPNELDIAHRYCPACHWWTGDPELGPPHLEDECAARESRRLVPVDGCPCGEVHLIRADLWAACERMMEIAGDPLAIVTVRDVGTFRVPRLFLACHTAHGTVSGSEFAGLAERFGFERVGS